MCFGEEKGVLYMKIGFIAFGVLVIGTVAALAMSDYIIPSTWRYKITIEVETPEGEKIGTAIRQVTAQLNPQITPETHPISYRIK